MEFRPNIGATASWKPLGFNPCFSGYGIQTLSKLRYDQSGDSFNPCFSGYGIQTQQQVTAGLNWF